MTGPRLTAYEDVVGNQLYPEVIAAVRHLIDFLQWRYSKHPAGAYHYDCNSENDTEIIISADTPIDPVKVGFKPAITVLRAHAGFQGVGLGDVAFTDLKTGAKVYMDLLPTTLMVNVLSTLPIEAERLAAYTANQIRGFRDAICATLPELLYLGQRVSLSPVSPAGSLVAGDSPDIEWSVCVVAVPTFLQTAQTALPLNKPILSSVRVTGSTAERPAVVEPVELMQGTAVAQATQSDASRITAASEEPLLQTGGNEAQSSQPLPVDIET